MDNNLACNKGSGCPYYFSLDCVRKTIVRKELKGEGNNAIREELFGSVCLIGDWGDNQLTEYKGSRHPDHVILGCRRMSIVWNDSKGKGNGMIKVEGDSFGVVTPDSFSVPSVPNK